MITLYGINNCDTVKKAKNWLSSHELDFNFHDYKKAGLDKALLQQWIDEFGYENLLNKRGTTWRKLDEKLKETLDENKAIGIMLEHTSIIKRPLLDMDGKRILGFDEKQYQKLL